MSKAKDLINLVEQDDHVQMPDGSKTVSKELKDAGWVTHWSGSLVEYECPNFEDGRLQVYDFGSWHWKVRGQIVDKGESYQSLGEFLKDNFGLKLTMPMKDEE